jgi:hypothetical protein
MTLDFDSLYGWQHHAALSQLSPRPEGINVLEVDVFEVAALLRMTGYTAH